MKKIIEKILKVLAKIIIRKYKPLIIGITGSVGKTSTKEAIDLILRKNFSVRSSLKNYNNELGVPLTIINAEAAGKSLLGWLKIFFQAKTKIIFNVKFPKILILEMAADKPGDIFYLLEIVQPQIGVLTSIAPVHLEKFRSLENILKEKQKIITSLPKDGWAILNVDDELVFDLKNKVQSKIITFGFSEDADLKALEPTLSQSIDEKGELKLEGLNFKINYQGKVIPVFLPNIIAKHQVYSVLAAISVGIALDLNLLDVVDSLKDLKMPPGRMQLIKGIKNSLIIDDSYNSSPKAVEAALGTLSEISLLPGRRKIVVLGDMLELGSTEEEAHKEIGKQIIKPKFDILITVGNLAKKIAEGAKEDGLPEEGIFKFDNSIEAGKFLKEKIIYGDVILVKGSQGVRMEGVVKEIMAEPERANQLLVRQGNEWQKI